ncbi:hypothetical protein [Gimesia sp.]|uniref:hypothetical protein n=1 Tax=Gimesia sp. TaxID=2024833 RepID=UPI003A8FD9EE
MVSSFKCALGTQLLFIKFTFATEVLYANDSSALLYYLLIEIAYPFGNKTQGTFANFNLGQL